MSMSDYLKTLMVLAAMVFASSGMIGCEDLMDEDDVTDEEMMEGMDQEM